MQSMTPPIGRGGARRALFVAIALILHAMTPLAVRAQCSPLEQGRLLAADAAASDQFGVSVAIFGDTAVAGAYFDDDAGNASGAAYVFVRSAGVWTQQAKLYASDASTNDQFGVSVAIDGDTIAVGAYGKMVSGAASAGAVYVFVRSGMTWTEQAKLTASDAASGDLFGGALSLAADTLMIGASGDNNAGGNDAGASYVFTRSGTIWTEQAKLTASDGATLDSFGRSVALSGETAVIGALFDDLASTNDAGSAYVFTRAGTVWSQQAKLTASDAAASDRFGISVALSGDTALIGSYQDDHAGGNNAGSAYAFTRSGIVWTQQAKLTAAAAADSDLFGFSVALAGHTAVIGAQLDDTTAGANSGSAYLFTRSGSAWTERSILLGADSALSDQLGSFVALSADTAVIAAPLDDTPGGGDSGSAYVFALGCDDDADGVLDLDDNCPLAANPSQTNSDADTHGDACDNCPLAANADQADGDGDGVGNVCDNCPSTVNPSQTNSDADTHGDACDNCPFVASADQNDSDGDGDGNACDNCTFTPNPDQTDADTDGDGDACDNCPMTVNANQADCDADGVGDRCELDCNGNGVADKCEVSAQLQKLVASNASLSDAFGTSVALWGDTAIVGAPGFGFAFNGAAYALVRSGAGWAEQAFLGSGPMQSQYGSAVAVFSDYAVVGAPGEDGAGVNFDLGAAYVYVRTGIAWSLNNRIAASDAASSDRFGAAVAVSGSSVLVGANSDSVGTATDAGSAYWFDRVGSVWVQLAKLTASDAGAGDQFGSAIALLGHAALIGAPMDDNAGGANAGAVYFFLFDGVSWAQQSKLVASDGEAGDNFGGAITLLGNTALIGAPGDNHAGGADAGSVYVFTYSGGVWTEQVRLSASDAAAGDRFGGAVALAVDAAVIAAREDDLSTNNQGSAYTFAFTGGAWTERVKLTPTDGAAGDLFGTAVAADGTTALVAAAGDDLGFSFDAGSLYVFGVADCNANGAPDTCEQAGDMDGSGAVDAADLPLFIDELLNNMPACVQPADVNGDGSANGDDVQPFVDQLLN